MAKWIKLVPTKADWQSTTQIATEQTTTQGETK